MLNKIILFTFFSLVATKSDALDYCKITKKIISSYSAELSEHGFFLAGQGGRFMEDLKEIDIDYDSYQLLNLEEVRRIYVEIVEGYLKKINSSEKLRPYLHNFPFTHENIDLMISFMEKNGRRAPFDYISLVGRGKENGIFYSVYNHEKGEFVTVHRESYEEALSIVKHEKMKAL